LKTTSATFHGGIHPPYNKESTQNRALIVAPVPELVRIPLAQHIGAPARAVVKPGDTVKTGQVIAEAGGFVSVPHHSSISGKVKFIKEFPHPFGGKMPAIEIESDGKDEKVPPMRTPADWRAFSPEDIKNRIKDAGIVGLGGAAFPTHVKLSPPEGKKIRTLLINGAECEPFLTCDHRLMLEKTDEILEGIRIMAYALNVEQIIIGIESNKLDAVEIFRQKTAKDAKIAIVICEAKYPQGSELQLIKAALDIELPKTKLPMEAGVVIQNVGSAFAVYEAAVNGKPLYERALTIAGDGIIQPGNYIIRIGTLFGDIIKTAGGIRQGIGNIGKLIMGGPMMGLAQSTTEVPVIKGTSGILLMPEMKMTKGIPLTCIRCGKCELACPMNLPAARLGLATEFEKYRMAEDLAVMECMECGSCSYVCPSNRPMTQYMRISKAVAIERKAKEKAGSGK
jgi:Na+-translocating ferredoxin:NAD+ oxidoreductase subunit C